MLDSCGTSGLSATDNSKSFGECPKGTTEERKRQGKKHYLNCIASICEEYSAKLTKMKAADKHLPHLFLDKLIERKKSEFHLTMNIPKATIHGHVLQGNFNLHHCGTK